MELKDRFCWFNEREKVGKFLEADRGQSYDGKFGFDGKLYILLLSDNGVVEKKLLDHWNIHYSMCSKVVGVMVANHIGKGEFVFYYGKQLINLKVGRNVMCRHKEYGKEKYDSLVVYYLPTSYKFDPEPEQVQYEPEFEPPPAPVKPVFSSTPKKEVAQIQVQPVPVISSKPKKEIAPITWDEFEQHFETKLPTLCASKFSGIKFLEDVTFPMEKPESEMTKEEFVINQTFRNLSKFIPIKKTIKAGSDVCRDIEYLLVFNKNELLGLKSNFETV